MMGNWKPSSQRSTVSNDDRDRWYHQEQSPHQNYTNYAANADQTDHHEMVEQPPPQEPYPARRPSLHDHAHVQWTRVQTGIAVVQPTQPLPTLTVQKTEQGYIKTHLPQSTHQTPYHTTSRS